MSVNQPMPSLTGRDIAAYRLPATCVMLFITAS